MKTSKLKIAATGLLLAAALGATPAAAAVCITMQVNGTSTQTACDSGTGLAGYTGTIGNYSFQVSGTGIPAVLTPNLLTNSVNISGTGGNDVVTVAVTQTGLTAFTGGLTSAFTSNTVTGVAANIATYLDPTNMGGMITSLESQNFTGPGLFSGTDAVSLSNPFSETVLYTLTFDGSSNANFNGTANLVGSVPEPATWAMMLLGFVGIGAAMRRTRSSTVLQQLA